MGQFLEAEKLQQIQFKVECPFFSADARREGMYRGKLRPFCVPRDFAEENLFDGIRSSALDYFARQKIKRHDGSGGKPSNHLCSSQVCCVNFLFPFAGNPQALLELLHPVFPAIREMLPMELDGQFVSFEWIGSKNHLCEHKWGTRGANCTSADAAVMFTNEDGARQIVLIEWKYTESYSGLPLMVSANGTDRTGIYLRHYESGGCPISKPLLSECGAHSSADSLACVRNGLPEFAHLFYEPFYQLMRQQFLAERMETVHELGADVVSVLHISPGRNSDFRTVTSPALRHMGTSVTEVWTRLVRQPDRFTSVSTEALFGTFPISRFPELSRWWRYVNDRYMALL